MKTQRLLTTLIYREKLQEKIRENHEFAFCQFANFDFTDFTRSDSIKKKVAYLELEVKDDHVLQGPGFNSEGKKLFNFKT